MNKGRVDKVFFDGVYCPGGLSLKEVAIQTEIYREFAVRILKDTGADHVLYCSKEYDSSGKIAVAKFYSGLVYSDEEFYKATSNLIGDYHIGAVHKKGV